MRRAIVTRTIESTKVNYMACNVQTAEIIRDSIEVAGKFKTDADCKKYLDKLFNLEELVIVKIESTEIIEKLYGMYEDDFLKFALEMKDRFNFK